MSRKLTLVVGAGAWLLLSCLHDAVFALHSDLLGALYLCLQIGPVYAALLYLAYQGVQNQAGRRVSLPDFGLVSFPLWQLWWCLPCLLAILTGQTLWQLWLLLTNITVETRESLITAYTHLPLSRTIMIVFVCGIGPFTEEILYRGLLFRWLLARYTPWLAVCISALIFVVAHLLFALPDFDMGGLVSYFLTGVFCALLTWTTGSLYPALCLHISLNILFVIATLLHPGTL
jgi:membrane protease YdiL (CAAX protease family)